MRMHSFIPSAAFLLLASVPAMADPTGVAVWRQTSQQVVPSMAGTGAGAVMAAVRPGVSLANAGTVYLPTDNLDAKGCAIAGLLMPDGTLVAAGQLGRVKFTVNGGKPAIGATAWVASSEDDGARMYVPADPLSVRGRLTATLPPVDANPQVIYDRMRQNLAPAGIVVDNSTYDADQTATVRVTPQTHCQFADQAGHSTVKADATQLFRGVKLPLSPPASFTADGSSPLLQIRNNETLIITFIADDVVNTPDTDTTGWRCYNDSTNKGWAVLFGNSNRSLLFQSFEAGGNHQANFVGSAAPGKNIIIVTRYAGSWHVNLNGSRGVATLTDAGVDSVVGRVWTMDYAFGATTGIVKLGRAMDDTEIQAVSGAVTGDADQQYSRWFIEGLNPYAPDPMIVSDLSMQWFVDMTAYTGGVLHAVAGPAGSAFDFTTGGTPVVRTMTYSWFANPAQWLQDGEVPSYDSRHSSRHSPLERIRFRVQHQYEWAMAMFGTIGEDVDNNDEGASPTTFVSNGGVSVYPIVAVTVGAEGDILYRNHVWFNFQSSDSAWWLPLGPGPYDVDMLPSDLFLRETTNATGEYINRLGLLTNVAETGSPPRATSVIESDFTTADRLTIVGDALISGHLRDKISASPYSGSVCVRMRAAYPGKVTCDAFNQSSLARLEAWGSGNMEAYARRVIDMSHQGNPATRRILVTAGYGDWAFSVDTAAATAARLGRLVDWIHAIDPIVPLIWARSYCTPALSQSNNSGITYQAFADAAVAEIAKRPFVTVIDVTGPNTITWSATGPFGFVPAIDTGQQPLADNFRAALGY